MNLQSLLQKKLIQPPSWLIDNLQYLTICGSHAYGVADTSIKNKIPDYDYYGICIPPKNYIFPHLSGEIYGFGTPGPRFDQWQEIGIEDKEKKCKYDFTVYNIVKYFELCRGCNPNMIDSLYVPTEYITHITKIGHLIRDNRHLFLSKLAYHRFRGYAFSQLKKSVNHTESKEVKDIRKFEEDNNIPHTTSIEDIKNELKSRGLA